MNLKPFIAALYIFLCHTLSAATPDTLVVAVEAKANPGQAPEVAFARKLANHLNTQFEPYLCPWARCLKAIETGDADIILSVFETQDRKAAMAFVEPALAEHVIRFEFLQKKGKSIPLRDYQDLKRYTVITQRGNKYFERFDTDDQLTKQSATTYQKAVDMLLAERGELLIDLSITRRDLYLPASKLNQIRVSDYIHNETKAEYLAVSLKSKWRYQIGKLSDALQYLKRTGQVQKYIKANVIE